MPTIANSVTIAVGGAAQRDAAIVTFLVTASGLTMGGIGAPFWALIAGGIVLGSTRLKRQLQDVVSSRAKRHTL